MTIGKKFLERVLNEDKDKDVDGFKDDFDITSMSASSPAISNLTMPMARQVVQLYHLLGVSAETLESRPAAVKEAAMEMADKLRTDRPLRVAAQRLFKALANGKGFSRVKAEAMADMPDMNADAEEKIRLQGSQFVKQIESVLAAMRLPSGVLKRSMRMDQQALMDTAKMIMTGAVRTKFMVLAELLGVDLQKVGSEVSLGEATTMGTVGTSPAATAVMPAKSGIDAFHAAASELIAELGLNVSALPNARMLDRKMMIAQRGDAFNTRAIRAMKTLTTILKGNNR